MVGKVCQDDKQLSEYYSCYLQIFYQNIVKIGMKYEKLKELIFLKGSQSKILDILESNQKIDFIEYTDKNHNTVLHYAISYKYPKVIEKYFQLVRKRQLWLKQYPEITDQVIQYKLRLWINAENSNGHTALHYACAIGYISAIKLLEDFGARFDIITNQGLNVFNLAAKQGKLKVMMFLDGKVDPNATDLKKCSPLHWATYHNQPLIVKYLVTRHQSQIDFQQQQGRTALHLAVLNSKVDIVKILLIGGANRLIKDQFQKTAIDYAEFSQNPKIEQLLTLKQKLVCSFKGKYVYAPQPKPRVYSIFFLFLVLYAICLQNYFLITKYEKISEVDKIVKIIQKLSSFVMVEIQFLLITLCLFLSLYIFYSKPSIDKKSLSEISDDIQDIQQICFECRNIKDEGIVHCYLCNQCVNVRLKHSQFLNTCIGNHNQYAYFILLLTLFITLFLVVEDGAVIFVYVLRELSPDRLPSSVYLGVTYFMICIDFLCIFLGVGIIRSMYVTLKIRRRMRSILINTYLSESTFDSSSTLLARKMSTAKAKKIGGFCSSKPNY